MQRRQNTLANSVEFSGIGIHTGTNVTMKFCPAPASTGIVFKRTDLPSTPIIPATVEYVVDTSRSTILGIGDVRVHTVEHVLAALHAYKIDNLYIEVDNLEPPVGNGSSDVFIDMIERAGIIELNSIAPTLTLEEPVFYSDNEIQIVALPAAHFRISYTLSYSDHPLLKAQFHDLVVTQDSFKKEIAPCRTFSLFKEISYLIDKGLIKGGSLDNAVVIHDEAVYSKGGLFFPDEMVRHKVLDLIGDLALVGLPFNAHIISIRSGHSSNYHFSKKLLKSLTRNVKNDP